MSPGGSLSDRVIAIVSLGRTRFFAVRRDFHYGASRRRRAGTAWRGPVVDARPPTGTGESADGAERNGGGEREAPAELINSDGLLSSRPFERQHTVTFVFDEEEAPAGTGGRTVPTRRVGLSRENEEKRARAIVDSTKIIRNDGRDNDLFKVWVKVSRGSVERLEAAGAKFSARSRLNDYLLRSNSSIPRRAFRARLS